MGTNYYLRSTENPHCPTCTCHADIHIGKSSAGWCFSLHVIPDRGINTLDDWRREWNKPNVCIIDEYDQVVSKEEMEETITQRAAKQISFSGFDFARNYAVPGPNGLVRHASEFCVGHGEGTWDYITGEFS